MKVQIGQDIYLKPIGNAVRRRNQFTLTQLKSIDEIISLIINK